MFFSSNFRTISSQGQLNFVIFSSGHKFAFLGKIKVNYLVTCFGKYVEAKLENFRSQGGNLLWKVMYMDFVEVYQRVNCP